MKLCRIRGPPKDTATQLRIGWVIPNHLVFPTITECLCPQVTKNISHYYHYFSYNNNINSNNNNNNYYYYYYYYYLLLLSLSLIAFDSHLALGIFSELSGIRILLLPSYIVHSWSYAGGRPISSNSPIQSSLTGVVIIKF